MNEVSVMHYLIPAAGIRILEFDPLGNLYILDEKDRISKYDTTGHLLSHVVNQDLGEAHSLDVGNPFKTMIFYRDQQVILIYDRTLSEIQRIRLNDWGLNDVTSACLSPDNAFWIFDGKNKVLVKLTNSGHALVSSDPFDILNAGSPRPDFIYDLDHFLLVKEVYHPISVFDDFGKFLYTTDILKESFFSLSSKFIVTSSDQSLQRYDIVDRKMLSPISLKENMSGDKVYLYGDRIFGVDRKGVYIIPRVKTRGN